MGDIQKYSTDLLKFSKSEHQLRRAANKKYRNILLANATAELRDLTGSGNVFDMLEAEQMNINLEKRLYAKTPQDEAKYDNQSNEATVIGESLNNILDVKRYRERCESMKVLRHMNPDSLPEREPFAINCNRQIKYLGSAKNGFSEPKDKDFFTARQENLRSVLRICRERQREALTPDAVSDKLAEIIKENTDVQEPKIHLHPYTKGQWFAGKIIHADVQHGRCIQQTAPRLFTVHRFEKLETKPEEGQDLKITYPKDGARAKLEPIVQKQSRSLHR